MIRSIVCCSTQTSMNAALQMEAVNTVVLAPLGASSADVTQGTSWMEMDWTAVVGVELTNYINMILPLYTTAWPVVLVLVPIQLQRIWLTKSMPCCSTDINECSITNGGCEHSCTNTIGSFICSCDTGYQMDENGLDCNGESLFNKKPRCFVTVAD